jgi:transglutaminase-like putative cysteine protease
VVAKLRSITPIQVAYFVWALPAVLFATATQKRSAAALARRLGKAIAVPPGTDLTLPPSRDTGDLLIHQAVRRASHWLPGAHNCLPQAIAATHMLRVLKRPSQVVIGIRPNPQGGEWDSHAWVTTESGTVIGGEVAKDYTAVTIYRKILR